MHSASSDGLSILFDATPLAGDGAGPLTLMKAWAEGWRRRFPQDRVSLSSYTRNGRTGMAHRLVRVAAKAGVSSPGRVDFRIIATPTAATALRGRRDTAIACYDFRHLHQNDKFSLGQLVFRRLVWDPTYRRAVTVLAISTSTAVDFSQRFSTDPTVVGLAPSVLSLATIGSEQKRSGIVAIAHRPNKPPSRAIAIWEKAFVGESEPPPLTIMAGRMVRTVDHLPRGVTMHEYLCEKDYSQLLSRSRILLFATDYEGLGIPLLEAHAAELPFVAPELHPLRSVAGVLPLYPQNGIDAAASLLSELSYDDSAYEAFKRGMVANSDRLEKEFFCALDSVREGLIAGRGTVR